MSACLRSPAPPRQPSAPPQIKNVRQNVRQIARQKNRLSQKTEKLFRPPILVTYEPKNFYEPSA